MRWSGMLDGEARVLLHFFNQYALLVFGLSTINNTHCELNHAD